MGYRSDLVVVIYPDTQTKEEDIAPYDAMKTFMATTFKEVADTFHDDLTWHDDYHCLKFKIDDAKWYKSYPDVQVFEDMMRFFRDETRGYCTEYARVGESNDDIEEIYTGHNMRYMTHIKRAIECDI